MRDIIRHGERVADLLPEQSQQSGARVPPGVGPDAQADTSSAGSARNPRAALQALRARSRGRQRAGVDLQGRADDETDISGLEGRIHEMDGLLATLRANLQQGQTSTSPGPEPLRSALDLDDLREQLKTNSRLLQEQGERLGSIERRLDEHTPRPATAVALDSRWEVTVEALRTRIDKRLDSLERHLANARDNSRELRDRDQTWAQSRLRRLGGYLGIGLVALGLLTIGLFGVEWSRIEQRIDRIAMQQRDQASSTAEDLRLRLDQLEQNAGDLKEQVERTVHLAAGLTGKIEALARDQQTLSRRLDEFAGPPKYAESRQDSGNTSTQPITEKAGQQTPAATQDRYTIQLIGFRNESSIAPFARRYGLTGEARYLRERSRGRDWYSVLLGDYASYDAAAAAADRLPPELRELEPWIRSIPPGMNLSPID
ncbi:MAG: SPOR domain-containing protein [Chromatiaceae bacterium]